MIAIVILLRVLYKRECRNGGNELSNVRSFIILRSRGGLTSFNIDNSAIFFNEKKYNEAFRGVYFLKNTRKNL